MLPLHDVPLGYNVFSSKELRFLAGTPNIMFVIEFTLLRNHTRNKRNGGLTRSPDIRSDELRSCFDHQWKMRELFQTELSDVYIYIVMYMGYE